MKIVCGALLFFNAVLFAAPRITSYRAQIHAGEGRSFSLEIAIGTGAEAWAKPVHSLETYAGERLSNVAVRSSDGQSLSFRLDRVGLLDRLILDGSAREYSIRYVIEAPESGPLRIPLAVPELPTTGAAGAVTITFYPPSGEVITGDMFPAFQRVSGSFIATLSNVPNHVHLDLLHANDAGIRQRWLTPSLLSDLVVITLILLGSLARVLIRRKARGVL